MDSKTYRDYHWARLRAVPQAYEWEHGPSNRLAICPGLLGALALDFELCCSSYQDVQQITADLNPYEKCLLWANLPPNLVAKIRRLKTQSTAQKFISNVVKKHTARPKPPPQAHPSPHQSQRQCRTGGGDSVADPGDRPRSLPPTALQLLQQLQAIAPNRLKPLQPTGPDRSTGKAFPQAAPIAGPQTG